MNVGDKNFIADPEHLADHRLPDDNSGTAITDTASNAQVSMDSYGDFIITWEAFEDNDQVEPLIDVVNSYGIYYRRFVGEFTDSSGNSLFGTPDQAVDHQANLTITALAPLPDPYYSLVQSAPFAGDQVNPAITMDADGDYYIVWNGNGATADALDPADKATQNDPQGVFVRSFHASGLPADSDEAVTPQSRVNFTSAGYQGLASIAATPSGSYVVDWSGNGNGDSNGVYVARYTSPVDNAGPMVVHFLLPNGSMVSDTTQVTQSLQAVVITFDEDMLDNATHTGNAVTNPANYQMLENGSAVLGGISQVYYGLDIANQLGSQYGLNIPRLNKYEAVLIVDGNGSGPGVLPLSNGQYQFVVSNNLRDKAGNPLRSSGLVVNGQPMSGTLNVTVPTGQETKVNSDAAYANTAYGKYTTASTANSVAADAEGDYVVVWTDTTPGHQGVWAKMYQQTSTLNPDGTRTTTAAPFSEILVSSDPTASDIAVARDTDGDFVVTWSAWNATTDWDIFAQRFNAAGQTVGDIFRVNATTTGTQRYSAVAMDAQGDFVITWQSHGQDGSGSGIYAQAYNASGETVNGTDEIQAIDFVNGFTGTFRLRWDNDNNPATPDLVTAPITFNGNASDITAAVKSALNAIGADVNVVTNGLTEVLIQFVGAIGQHAPCSLCGFRRATSRRRAAGPRLK